VKAGPTTQPGGIVPALRPVLARGQNCDLAATAWPRRPEAARLRGEWREEGTDGARQRGLAGGAVGGRGGGRKVREEGDREVKWTC
jgi:hypothetical protein